MAFLSDGLRPSQRGGTKFNAFDDSFFFVCRDLVESWRNPIRSITSRCPIAQNHEKAMVIISFLTIACHQAPGSPIEIMTGGLSRTHNCTIKKHMNIYVERQGDTHK